jgi:uncharacterized membrane protein
LSPLSGDAYISQNRGMADDPTPPPQPNREVDPVSDPAEVGLPAKLEEQLAEVIEPLPVESQQEVRAIFRQVVTVHSGPLPAPHTLAEYDRVQPGLAERIVQMTEKEQLQRHSIENKIINMHVGRVVRGQWIAAGLAVLFGSFGTYLAVIDKPAASITVFGTTIVGLVGIFIWGRKSESPPPMEPRPSNESDDAG